MSEQRRREDQTPRQHAAEQLVGQGPTTTPTNPARSGETVCVACNLPNGMLLRVHKMVSVTEATPNGSHTIQQARPVGDAVVIHGASVDVDAMRRGEVPEFRIAHGYALTSGVPADFWDAWLEQHKDAPYVKSKSIFAMSSESRARDKVKSEMSGTLSGLEPIDPENPASKSPELRGLTTLTRGSGSGVTPIAREERNS